MRLKKKKRCELSSRKPQTQRHEISKETCTLLYDDSKRKKER